MPHCIVCNSDYSGSLAICPKCGFVPDAILAGIEYPKLDPNVPDLDNYWCRKCRGHHYTILSGRGDSDKRVCKNCSSNDVHLVWFDITKRKFLFRFWGYPIRSFLWFSVTIPASFWIFSFLIRLAHGDDHGHEGGHHGLLRSSLDGDRLLRHHEPDGVYLVRGSWLNTHEYYHSVEFDVSCSFSIQKIFSYQK